MTIADRRAIEKARRRDDILQAARAVFSEIGWHRATVDAVAERAQISKGTIYLYFGSKESILAELLAEALADLAAHLAAALDRCPTSQPNQQLRAMAEAYLAFAQNAPDYFRLFTSYNSGTFQGETSSPQVEQLLAQSQATLEMVTQVVDDGMAMGMFIPGDPKVIAAVLWASLNGALSLLSHPMRRSMVSTSAEDFYRATLDLVLRGICK